MPRRVSLPAADDLFRPTDEKEEPAVRAVPEGRRSRYELTDPRIGHVMADLLSLVLVVDPDCTCLPDSTAEELNQSQAPSETEGQPA